MPKEYEMEQLAEVAWAAKRQGPDVNLERIEVLEAYGQDHPESGYGAIAMLLKGLSRFYHNAYDEALVLGEQAFAAITTSGSDLWKARCGYVLGLFSSSKNELPAALNYWKDGLALAEAIGDQELMGFLIYNIADMNRAIFKRYDTAKAYYKRGLKLCLGQEKHILCGLMLIGLSRCEFVDHEIDLSLTHAERALELSLESRDDRVIGICYEFAGSRYMDLDMWDKAYDYLTKSLENRSARNDHYGMVNSLCSLSGYYLKRGALDEALEEIHRSYDLYLTLNTHVLDDLLFKQLAEVYEARKEWELASQYYKRYSEARNTSMSKELEDMMSIIAAEHQVENAKKDAEIYRLKNVALREKNQEISLLAEELEQALEDLKDTQGELVRTSRLSGLLNLISGIAHEINTPLGNSLMLGSYMESEIRERLEDSAVADSGGLEGYLDLLPTVNHLMGNLARVAQIVESLKKFNIFPDRLVVQQEDLKDFLAHWIKDLAIQFPQLEVDFVFDPEATYSYRFEHTCLTQVLMEVVTNSVLHAYAQEDPCRVEVRLETRDQGLSLRLKDFGRGIDQLEAVDLFEPFKTLKQPSSGLGLGLHLVYLLTVNVLRGEVKLSSVPNEWTEVHLLLP